MLGTQFFVPSAQRTSILYCRLSDFYTALAALAAHATQSVKFMLLKTVYKTGH